MTRHFQVAGEIFRANSELGGQDLRFIFVDGESGLSISKGLSNATYVHKFGEAPDFDTADGVVTVWDGADDANIDQMVYQYSTSADIDSISSSSADDSQVVQLQGLDDDFDLVTQTATLNGQTRVALTTPLRRVFRMKNAGATDNAGHIYCYVNGEIAAGVPTTSTDVRAIIQPGYNQTLMALYSVPAGYTAYMDSWYVSTAGASKDSQYIVQLRAREYNASAETHKAFQLKHIMSVSDVGVSAYQHKYLIPQAFAAKVDIEMRVSATEAGAAGAAFSAGFDIVLVPE